MSTDFSDLLGVVAVVVGGLGMIALVIIESRQPK
jgi:hypothetical protein